MNTIIIYLIGSFVLVGLYIGIYSIYKKRLELKDGNKSRIYYVNKSFQHGFIINTINNNKPNNRYGINPYLLVDEGIIDLSYTYVESINTIRTRGVKNYGPYFIKLKVEAKTFYTIDYNFDTNEVIFKKK